MDALGKVIVSKIPELYGLIKKTGFWNSTIGQELFYRSYFSYKRFIEDPFHGLAQRHPNLFSQGHILDLGANLGYTATVFARALSPGFRVFAFEPDLANFQLLEQTIQRRKIQSKVVPIQAAIGESSGVAQLWMNPKSNMDHRVLTEVFSASLNENFQSYSVPLWSIDDFIAQNHGHKFFPVSFVKIDIQGFEVPALKGMIKTIEANPNIVIAAEFSASCFAEMGFSAEQFLEFFVQNGFHRALLRKDGVLLEAPTEYLGSREKAPVHIDLVFSRKKMF